MGTFEFSPSIITACVLFVQRLLIYFNQGKKTMTRTLKVYNPTNSQQNSTIFKLTKWESIIPSIEVVRLRQLEGPCHHQLFSISHAALENNSKLCKLPFSTTDNSTYCLANVKHVY
jgi:hypothetical protein